MSLLPAGKTFQSNCPVQIDRGNLTQGEVVHRCSHVFLPCAAFSNACAISGGLVEPMSERIAYLIPRFQTSKCKMVGAGSLRAANVLEVHLV